MNSRMVVLPCGPINLRHELTQSLAPIGITEIHFEFPVGDLYGKRVKRGTSKSSKNACGASLFAESTKVREQDGALDSPMKMGSLVLKHINWNI